ncbi:MAG: alpha/beta fold hydrolase [Gammaproteobacteria bacterium]|nr:alpha/beta fold hydrolase [Gammaproteobacteria bacterium]
MSMKLHFREYGSYRDEHPTLIFLHGLFGASSNWHSIARKLEPRFHILVPDLRNHGSSPHAQSMDYPAMGDDLAEFIEEHGLDSALLVGHSMGGKVAMWLALSRPALVSALVVVDIAPVNYPNRFAAIFAALNRIDLHKLEGREQADRILAEEIGEFGLRQFLLQNLQWHDGHWRWRTNLPVLQREMPGITTFPLPSAGGLYPGPVLFIHGSASDYMLPEYRPHTLALFPKARLRTIPGAGHWVYAEQPEPFFNVLNSFLQQHHEQGSGFAV